MLKKGVSSVLGPLSCSRTHPYAPRAKAPAAFPSASSGQDCAPLFEHLLSGLCGFGKKGRSSGNQLPKIMGLLNISLQQQIKAPDEPRIISGRECSKKHALSLSEGSIQQGRSHFDARSVHGVREHGKMARTPLAAFFNIPIVKCCA